MAKVILPKDYPEPLFGIDSEIILINKMEFYTNVRLKSIGKVKEMSVDTLLLNSEKFREKYGNYSYWIEFKSGKKGHFYEKQISLKDGK